MSGVVALMIPEPIPFVSFFRETVGYATLTFGDNTQVVMQGTAVNVCGRLLQPQ